MSTTKTQSPDGLLAEFYLIFQEFGCATFAIDLSASLFICEIPHGFHKWRYYFAPQT